MRRLRAWFTIPRRAKLRSLLTILSELAILVLAVLSLIYTIWGIKLAREAIELAEKTLEKAESWSNTEYVNSVASFWMAAQSICRENNVSPSLSSVISLVSDL